MLLWHFHKSKRVYFDVVVQTSDDPEFNIRATIYNNDRDNRTGHGAGKDKDYLENNNGRLIDAKGVRARYLRCHSNGNSVDDKNDYVEIDVFGRPVDTAASAPSANANGGKEPIKFELPETGFGSIMLDYKSANLEPEDFRDRPPFFAPKGTTVVSIGKSVSASVKTPIRGELKMLVDGDKSYNESSMIELPEGIQWVQIDLGAKHEVYAVLLWHYWHRKSVYFDVIVQVSNDPEFKTGVTTFYNNDMDNKCGFGAGKEKQYLENFKGRLVDAKGVTARYVRCYSNGNSTDKKNHYVEIEVFGRPVK